MKILIKNIISIAILFSFISAEEANYLWPTNASNTATAFFGEMRPHRYHTGLDIRTYGINGKEVYAITDGYIYRIKVSNDGYGNVIYLKHQDGNISLYAHLDKFNSKIEKIVNQLQFKRNSFSIDHLLEPGLINVYRGEIIGYTGDTGGLSGPHLHFEIRDEINRPINPLKTGLFKSFTDSKTPTPKTIAFLPKTPHSKIDGHNAIKEYSLKEINQKEFVLNDTINIQGGFGIALKVFDKVDSQPFNYGIYSIEMFVNDEYYYGIEFDKTSFNQSEQAYLERNYELLSKNKGGYYQLFKDDFQNNSFINKESKGFINKKNGIHNFKIIVKDISNNTIKINGNFIIKALNDFNYELFKLSDNSWEINCSNIEKIIDFNCTIYEQKTNSIAIPCLKSYHITNPYAEIVNDTTILIYNTDKKYNTVNLKLNTLNGKTVDKYILLDESPNDIKGKLLIDHSYDKLAIKFIENKFSALKPILSYRKNDSLFNEPLIRINKNTLASKHFNIEDFLIIEDIQIEYKIDNYTLYKESNIEKMIVYPDMYSQKTLRDGELSITHEKGTFFDRALIYVMDYKIDNYESIIDPFYIGPNAIPFNKPINIDVNLFNYNNIKNAILCSYNEEKNKWIPLNTKRTNKTLQSSIKKGSIIGTIIDIEAPIIENIIPRNGATYELDSLNEFEIFLKDNLSGVNDKEGIILELNGQNMLIGFNLYQEKILINRLQDYLKLGKNEYNLIVTDNANNTNQIKGNFFIK